MKNKQKKNVITKKRLIIILIIVLLVILICGILFLKNNYKKEKPKEKEYPNNHPVKSYDEALKISQDLYSGENRNVVIEDDPNNNRYIIYVTDTTTGKNIYKFYMFKHSGAIIQVPDTKTSGEVFIK